MAETFSSNFDRRRAKRVRPGPLKVAMDPQAGVLLDVSDTGALIGTGVARPPDESIAFAVEWNQESILLSGRVVRTAMRHLPPVTESGLPRVEHHVAVEFGHLPDDSVARLRQLLRAAR
jgi:hypothetical protein